MTDRALDAGNGWILTVDAGRQGRRGVSSPQVWLAMYPDKHQALAAVRKAGGVSRVAVIEAHQPIADSLAVALNLISGQVKRFG